MRWQLGRWWGQTQQLLSEMTAGEMMETDITITQWNDTDDDRRFLTNHCHDMDVCVTPIVTIWVLNSVWQLSWHTDQSVTVDSNTVWSDVNWAIVIMSLGVNTVWSDVNWVIVIMSLGVNTVWSDVVWVTVIMSLSVNTVWSDCDYHTLISDISCKLGL